MSLETTAFCLTCKQNIPNCECIHFSDKEFNGYQGRTTARQRLVVPLSDAKQVRLKYHSALHFIYDKKLKEEFELYLKNLRLEE